MEIENKERMMRFKEYVDLAVRTESCDMSSIRKRLGNDNVIRMLHAAVGMTTEVAELFESLENIQRNITNAKEEFGDLFWYIAVAFDATRAEFGNDFVMPGDGGIISGKDWLGADRLEMNLESAKKALLVAVAEYVDVLKRTIYYDEYCLEIKKIEGLLMRIYSIVVWMVGVVAGAPSDIYEDNIEKLRKRYGEKFNEVRALHRDVKNELSHIEK